MAEEVEGMGDIMTALVPLCVEPTSPFAGQLPSLQALFGSEQDVINVLERSKHG